VDKLGEQIKMLTITIALLQTENEEMKKQLQGDQRPSGSGGPVVGGGRKIGASLKEVKKGE
jgi:hypothetical protein